MLPFSKISVPLSLRHLSFPHHTFCLQNREACLNFCGLLCLFAMMLLRVQPLVQGWSQQMMEFVSRDVSAAFFPLSEILAHQVFIVLVILWWPPGGQENFYLFYPAFLVASSRAWSAENLLAPNGKNLINTIIHFSWVQFSSVAQSPLTLCDPMNHSTPGLPVHHQWPDFTQIYVHWVGDTIQLFYPLLSPSPLALNLSQIRVFSNKSVFSIRWPKYWSLSCNISPSNEHPGLISFKMDWLDLLAVQETLNNFLQHHSSKASILWHSAFFMVQLSHPYMTTEKTITLTRWTFAGKVMSLIFNMLSRLVITFLPRSKCLLISWLQSPSAVILKQTNKQVCHCFHCFPIYLPWSDGTGCHDLSFLNVEFQANFFTLLFHFHQEAL